MLAIAKINLQINQNWDKVVKLHKLIREQWVNGTLPEHKKIWISNYNEYRYDFGDKGSFNGLDEVTAEKFKASALNGEVITAHLPWISKFKEDFKDINPVSFSILETNGSLLKHADETEFPEVVFHCKLNYIIHNANGTTYADNNGTIENYPSVAGACYLLDTTKVHWVECEETRHMFSVGFHRPFAEVYEWLQQRPNLSYSE